MCMVRRDREMERQILADCAEREPDIGLDLPPGHHNLTRA